MKKLGIPLITNEGENSVISEHFGHAPYFGFVKIDGSNYEVEVIKNPMEEHGPGDIPNYMKENDVNVMIVRGIGGRAIDFFNSLGIEVYRGAAGTIKDLVNAYLKDEIEDKEYEVKEKHHHH
ncbi:dinitrogenase iron-molybdenum cofactor biosynthesis protein [Tepiditoga spiralis]|uniref:Dinitrogenase iron-molybdenum cofactor biosynthesis protein n=1 Tax=Tepiditoga spiralis TaxID=2108365 RepID=A0A7G1G4A2_9BACT|nr:NifB/NifX family molybdenum-iron cluster-binding protein [Tepiditoga spiralis]BBE31181.1 dinitrogenase iron-molybdenum cofactor biosynthesis protein [Tepiditoga spiralis]